MRGGPEIAGGATQSARLCSGTQGRGQVSPPWANGLDKTTRGIEELSTFLSSPGHFPVNQPPHAERHVQYSMSSPSGGFAGKMGDRFEAAYVVSAVLDLIDGDLASLRWEGVGTQFTGIEFRAKRADGTMDAVQCKSGAANQNWSIAALAHEGLLAAIRIQLTEKRADRFVLVLAGTAFELSALSERARASEAVADFRESLSKKLVPALSALLTQWGLSDEGIETARQWLRRIAVCSHQTPDSLHKEVERRCGDRFAATGAVSLGAIRDILEERLGQEITGDLVISLLRSDRYKIDPRDWGRLPDRIHAVSALRDRFRNRLGRQLIRGRLIQRAETDAVLKALAAEDGPRVIFLHGSAGVGKSGVLLDTVERLVADGVCVIPLRLDDSPPTGSLWKYSREILELPDTPVRCAERLSPGRQAIVVMDQLDAVRWAGTHSLSAWDVALELLEAASRSASVRVIVSCRSFDMKDDPNIRNWKREQASWNRIQEIEVKPLDPPRVLEALGASQGGVTAKQIALLGNPLLLSLWCRLSDGGVDLSGVAGATRLLAEHWKGVKRQLLLRYSISDQMAEETMAAICTWAEDKGQLDFPVNLVANSTLLESLASESYLDALPPSRYRVAHQRYLDHQIAVSVQRQILRTGHSVVEWLRSTDQSLMRREQVRHVLSMLRDDDPVTYGSTLDQLVSGAGVREHLRDLTLRFLAELDQPTGEEQTLVVRLLRDDEWRHRVLSRVITTPIWFAVVVDEGLIDEWLQSADEPLARRAAWLCKPNVEHHAARVEATMRRLVEAGGLMIERALWCLWPASEFDTPWIARVRFAAQRQGKLKGDMSEVVHLAKTNPIAALRHARHLFRWDLAHWSRPGLITTKPEAFDRWLSRRTKDGADLQTVATSEPQATFEALAPIFYRSIRWGIRRSREQPRSERRLLAFRSPRRRANVILRETLTVAARVLAQTNPAWLSEQLKRFADFRSKSATVFVLDTVSLLPPEHSAWGLQWVTTDPRRCGVKGRWSADYFGARRAIRQLCSHAETDVSALVNALVHFHDTTDLESVRYRDRCRREGSGLIPNRYGLAQYLLLSALPPFKLTSEQRHRVQQWRSKFGAPRSYRPKRDGGFGFVSHPIPHDRVDRVSDREWLRIVSAERQIRPSPPFKMRGRGYVDYSHHALSQALGAAAKRCPARFMRLAMRMPVGVPPDYLGAVLRAAEMVEPTVDSGPDWSVAPVASVEEVLERFKARRDTYYSEALAGCIRHRAAEAWSHTTIRQVCEIAMTHPDPAPGQYRIGITEESADVVNGAINCARGRAVEAVVALLWHRQDEMRPLLVETARTVVTDPHPCVRVAAIGLALPLVEENADLALTIFDQACSHPDDRILGSYHMGHTLSYFWWRDDQRVQRTVARMASSAIDAVAKHGALIATMMARRRGRLTDVTQACIGGTVPQRRGVAKALAQLADDPDIGAEAARDIVRFFDDEDSEVAGTAARVFHDEEVLKSERGPRLAQSFVGSKHFARDPYNLLLPLSQYQGSIVPYQPVIDAIVRRATDDMTGASGDFRFGAAGFAGETTSLILRIYDRAHSQAEQHIRDWCLDQIDALVARGDSTGLEALARLDKDA